MDTAPTSPSTQAEVAAATDHVVRLINDAWVVAMLSIGERTGLLQLLADHGPITEIDLAEKGGFHPRYVREWIWVLVAGALVDQRDGMFELRAGYDVPLTRAGGSDHWSRVAPQISAFATLEDLIVADFGRGVGLPHSTYDPLTDVLSAESGAIFDSALISEVLPRIGVTDALLGGCRVADLGCGEGHAVRLLAAEFPKSEFHGIDLSEAAIEQARQKAEAAGLANCFFRVGDIEPLELDTSFDLILAANAVHDLGNPLTFFSQVAAALNPGGVFCMHEISSSSDMPSNIAATPHVPGILGFSVYHCLPLSLGRGGIAPGGMYGRERYLEGLKNAGFANVEVFNAPSDPINDVFVARF
jgi:ubiquinone/menaquinone biosynthesis C-methylase UbiE